MCSIAKTYLPSISAPDSSCSQLYVPYTLSIADRLSQQCGVLSHRLRMFKPEYAERRAINIQRNTAGSSGPPPLTVTIVRVVKPSQILQNNP